MDQALLFTFATAVSSLALAGLLFQELIGDFRRLKPARDVAEVKAGQGAAF